MLNKSPIFLNCFSRGGSNILWNLFLTHPDVCSPIQETLQIFRFDLKGQTRAGWRVIWSSRQPRLFNQWYLQLRSPVPAKTQAFIDRTFFEWKLKTADDSDMKYKYEDEIYRLDEVKAARLVAKNNNGLAFLSDMFRDMYPKATFFALVRDPLALYESHKRRGITDSVESFASFYERIATRMIADETRMDRYHIVRFEDLLADPIGTMQKLYELAGLDFDIIEQVRFKAKAHYQANGKHTSQYMVGKHYWFPKEQVQRILEPKINQFQRDQLGAEEKAQLRTLTPVRAKLGYE